MIEIPEEVRATLRAKTFWTIATINEDGSPTVTPVWVDVDGDHVIVNTAVGRLKERNARRDKRVALATVDPNDPYSWAEIRGVVAEFVEGDAANAGFDRLTQKYLGIERLDPRPGQRVMLRIEPTRVNFRTEPRPDPS